MSSVRQDLDALRVRLHQMADLHGTNRHFASLITDLFLIVEKLVDQMEPSTS